MKPKKLRVAAVILLAVIIGGVIGWFAFLRTFTAFVDIKIVPAAKADAPKLVVQTAPVAQVELPKAAAVGANGGNADSQTEAAARAQAELKADFLNMGRLIRAGDYATFKETYDYIAPTQSDLDDIQRLRENQARVAANRARDADNPDVSYVQQLDIANAQSYEALANQTPTINAAGDEVTYQYVGVDYESGTYTGIGQATPLTFIKIDGRWYAKPANYKKPDSQGN